MAYLPGTITVSNITDVGATITVTMVDATVSDYPVSFSLSAAGQTTTTPTVTVPSGETVGTTALTGLVASTTYTLTANSGMAPGPDSQTFTTKATGYNVPRTATQEQWEDLADKVDEKAKISEVLSEPTGIEFVSTSNILDGAVTKDKIAFSTMIPVWSTFIYNSTSGTKTSKTVSGRDISFAIQNAGSGITVTDGGENTFLAKGHASFWLTGNTTSSVKINVTPVATGSSGYVRVVGGVVSGTATTASAATRTAGVNDTYLSTNIDIGKPRGATMEWTAMRKGTRTHLQWTIVGKIHCHTVDTSLSFTVQCETSSTSVVPCPYISGVASLADNATQCLEICEWR